MMKYLTKGALVLLTLAIGVLSGCGGSSTPATIPTTGNVVSLTGVAVKGPFLKDSVVTAYKLNNDGTRSTIDTMTTKTTDNLGSYDLSVTWGGLTEVTITGNYLDENTGTTAAKPGTVSAVVNLPTPTATATKVKANPNVASTMAAKVVQKTLKANPISATADAAAVEATITATIKSSDSVVAIALGLPTADAYGNAIELSSLNLLDTSDATLGAANKALLAVSATLQDAVNNGAAADIDAFVTTLVEDVSTGQALGSNATATGTATTTGANVTSILATSQTTVSTTIATIASNVTTVIKTENAAAVAADPTFVATITEDTALNTDLVQAVADVNAASAVVLRGFAMSNNSFNMGAQTFTIDAYGKATGTAGATTAVNNVVFAFTLQDLNNAAGTAAGMAMTYQTTLSYAIDAYGDARKVKGSLPITITSDGYGAVSATVPAGAVMDYQGFDSQGVNVVGTATNVAANAIQNNASAISIDVNALLTTIKSKVGVKSKAFDVLTTVGTYDFAFGISGINVGIANGNGIASLLPLDTQGRVGGRAIFGRITTK